LSIDSQVKTPRHRKVKRTIKKEERKKIQVEDFTLKMEAAWSSEKLEPYRNTTRHPTQKCLFLWAAYPACLTAAVQM
jgi:hypothetical protein